MDVLELKITSLTEKKNKMTLCKKRIRVIHALDYYRNFNDERLHSRKIKVYSQFRRFDGCFRCKYRI